MALRAFEVSPRLILVCALAVVALSPVEAQHLTPAGAEFQVNAFTPGVPELPGDRADGDGDFVVVWTEEPDGGEYDIFGRRFSSAGARPWPSTSRSTPTPRNSRIDPRWPRPMMAGSSSPGSSYFQDGARIGVFARRFSTDGTPQATEFQVNTDTAGISRTPGGRGRRRRRLRHRLDER